ncbi:AAA family ATPase [Candidatus Woesearchaeota archaeon]|nr:AAA family ATPase [Candidatus Woesearchaeota archaeon]
MVWFKDFGFNENPLDIRPNALLVGLDDHEDRLKNHVLKEELCFINGLTGTGKSSLLEKIQKEMKDHKFIYLDAHDLPKDFNLEEELKKKRSFFDKITLKNFPSKKPVLIIDEFQDTDKSIVLQARSSWEKAANRKLKSIVIAQISKYLKNVTPSFKERIGNRTITLPSLDDDELKMMIKLRLSQTKKGRQLYTKLHEKALELLIYASGQNPRRLLEYTDMLFDFHKQKFKDLNPLTKKDYKISYHAAKEILDVSGINLAGFDAVDEEKKKTTKAGDAFERYFNKDEKKILKFLLKKGPQTYTSLAMHTKISKKNLKKIVAQLKKKNGVRAAGREGRMFLWEVTPQTKRMTVKV